MVRVTVRLLLASSIIGAGILGACVGEDPTVDGSGGSDGGGMESGQGVEGGTADAGATDAGSGTDANGSADAEGGASCAVQPPSSAPGFVQCYADAGCSENGGTPLCCLSNPTNTSRCYTAAASCTALRFECDKASDCVGAGKIC